MKKLSVIIAAVVLCVFVVGACVILFGPTDPAASNKGKLVLDETMITFIEDGFEVDGIYDARLNPNGQRAITRANRTILEVEEAKGVQIDHEFVDYEMHSYSKVDDYNYVADMTFKIRNPDGEYSYYRTDVYFFCVEADTVGGFDLQVYCEDLDDYIKSLI